MLLPVSIWIKKRKASVSPVPPCLILFFLPLSLLPPSLCAQALHSLQNARREQIITHTAYTVSYNPDYKLT
ncbi:hypothetical protein Barb7_02412 [Bacteroidales bacterium Barb7]|nr:hypothetical protein Barb7_02412 [Bacteroidales bacterium Barb7]